MMIQVPTKFIAITLTATSADIFTLSLTWPGERILNPCKIEPPEYFFAVKKVDQDTQEARTSASYVDSMANTVSIPITSGPGKYIIVVRALSVPEDVTEVAVSSYSNGSPSFALSA